MKPTRSRNVFTLITAAAMMLVLTMLLSGCSSDSKTVKSSDTAPKARFDDTEILESSLLTRRGNGWALIASLDYSTRKEVLGCDILLLSNGSNSRRIDSPFMRLMLVTTSHPDTPVALRITVGSTCYSFSDLEMYDDGYARIPCGHTARLMLASLAECDHATLEVDYRQYGTGKEGTYTAVISRSRLSEWRKMAGLLESSNLWDIIDS